MAPGILVPEPSAAATTTKAARNDEADQSIFPDGLRTSGQHNPIYNLLEPYANFPKEITGPTVWHKERFESDPASWTHHLTPSEISELSAAADAFIASGTDLTGISKLNFPLRGSLGTVLATTLRSDLLDGKGFVLLRGFPATAWGAHKTAVAYMGLGTHLGYPVSQNGRGHVLGHVKDVGEDATQTHRVRIYRTSARQFFHVDDGDLVGLLCVHRAAEGGESDLVSAHAVWNDLQRNHADVAELLTRPVWYFDRKGEVSEGQEGWTRQPVFYMEPSSPSSPSSSGCGGGGKQRRRVFCKFDPYYVRSLARFSDQGLVPPLSDEQQRAIAILEETCQRLALHMVLEVGDIQLLSNAHVLHARTAYKDYPPPAPRRHLLRLWLATPESEGGWVLPFPDSGEKKRGGIQVNDNPPRCPLDAE